VDSAWPITSVSGCSIVTGGQLAGFRAVGRMLTVPPRNKLSNLILRRSKEVDFLSRIMIVKFTVERKMVAYIVFKIFSEKPV
jgi:hypothetical protein